jgi:uncharacterized membrane protein
MGALPMDSVHPLVVHFPIALLMTAVLLDVAAMVAKRPSLHRVALWNLVLGTLGAGMAVWTGYRAADIAKHSFEIHQVMELHRQLGIATLIVGGLVSVVRIWQRDQLGRHVRLGTLVAMLAMAGTLADGAHLGGRLVYEFGVGGAFGGSPPSVRHEDHQHH